MNFLTELKKGQESGNKGIPLGEGLFFLNRALNGVQKHRIYVVASPAKVGKSTFVNSAFVLEPYLYSLEHGIDMEWVYFSYEIDRVSMEYDFATFFLYNDFAKKDYEKCYINLPEGKTYTTSGTSTNKVRLTSDLLRGRILDDDGEVILLSDSFKEKLMYVYKTRIIPLFGEYSEQGIQLKKGKIEFIESPTGPTGLMKHLWEKADREGIIHKKQIDNSGRTKTIGYTPNNPNKYVTVIIDHCRKLKHEEKLTTLKQIVDKASEYIVLMRNFFDYTFVPIIHTNRNLGSMDRIRYFKDQLFPTSDDIMETSNLGQDADYVLTLMNPNDTMYNLETHFGKRIRDIYGNVLYPNLRSIHLVQSRHSKFPQHFHVNMYGDLKTFNKIDK